MHDHACKQKPSLPADDTNTSSGNGFAQVMLVQVGQAPTVEQKNQHVGSGLALDWERLNKYHIFSYVIIQGSKNPPSYSSQLT
jgi:hypothetical protein